MNLHQFYEEYENLSTNRKKEFLHKLIDTIVVLDDQEPAVWDLLDFVDRQVVLEEEDFYGTEGFDG